MTEKEKLFSAIYEACPELLNMTFGSRIKTKYGDYIATYEGGNYVNVTYFDGMPADDWNHRVSKKSITEIIGHPIRLEHLLRTAAARGKKIVIDVWGNVMEIIGENEHGINLNTPICRLDLSKPISEQPNEVYKKLMEIIC